MAQSDGHDAPGLIDELVPRHTAVVDEIVARFEDAVRQPQGDLLWADLNCSEVEVLQAPLYAAGPPICALISNVLIQQWHRGARMIAQTKWSHNRLSRFKIKYSF